MDEDRCEGAEHREPTAPSVDGLIARLEAATKGSRGLDSDIYLAVTREKDPEEFITEARVSLGHEPSDAFKAIHRDAYFRALADPPPYTTTTDVALGLIPGSLVDPCVEIQRFSHYCNASICWGPVEPFDRKSIDCTGRTLPIAVCILALRSRQIAPPTGRMELGERPNTESSPTTAAATRWQATLEAEKASILDFVVGGKIGDDPSPPAAVDALSAVASEHRAAPHQSVFDLAKRAREEVAANWRASFPAEADAIHDVNTDLLAMVEQAALNAITRVASEHQAALLARLRKPEMREAVAHALHRSINGPQAVWDGLRLGEMDWFRSHAAVAIAVITKELP